MRAKGNRSRNWKNELPAVAGLHRGRNRRWLPRKTSIEWQISPCFAQYLLVELAIRMQTAVGLRLG